VLHRYVAALTELFFDLNQEWTPPPKERLKRIRELNPAVAKAFDRSFGLANIDEQMQAAEQAMPVDVLRATGLVSATILGSFADEPESQRRGDVGLELAAAHWTRSGLFLAKATLENNHRWGHRWR
jgi:hypothetical protein